jgi:hypothetical protein
MQSKVSGKKGSANTSAWKPAEIPVRQVLYRNFGGRAQIDPDHASAPAGRHFREPAHAAAHVKHQFSLQVFGLQSGLLHKIRLRKITARVI